MCTRKMDSRGLLKKLTAVETCLFLGLVVGNLCFEIIGASRPGCTNPLGLEDERVQNSQLSSYTYDEGWAPFNARLNAGGAWCSDTNDVNHEFLQIDLLNVQHISRIATQGVLNSLWISYYVEMFEIEYSYDGTKWFTYKGSGGSIQTFHGNSDASSVKNNYFRDTFVTRYLRIYPKTYYRHMCLRVELYGCSNQSGDCSRYITTASGSINSLSFPGSYPGNKDCTWLIEVSKDKNIALMFTQFDVYQGSNPGGCQNDYVEVRDGLTDSSPMIGGKYCNQNRTMLITTKKNVARIYFHTGIANHGHKGFQLYFLSVTKGSDDVLSGTACDGEVLALDCSGYQNTIHILHARYQIGSFPFSCGQRHNYSSSTSCPAFNATAPAPTPQLTTSTTSTTTPSPFTIKTHMSHSLTSHVTESPSKVKATETPVVTLSKTTTRSTDPITEVTSTRTVDPIVGRREVQTTGSMTTRTMVIVIVVAGIAVVVVTLLIALFLCRKKRQRKDKKDALPAVGYIPEGKYSKANNGRGRCTLTYSASGNEYDTTNILYQSADSFSDHSSNKNEDGNAYASSTVLGGSMKVTENPFYPKVKSPRKGCDSPSNSPQLLPKMNCIHNPNYEKSLPFNHEYAVPKVENVNPQGKKCHV
ncbi:Coagulation factor V [Acropora cervicornis]|uniref:Coagulation factor V n=1 Tax=Acropora cervicornis TaxID=6130 RepID=A0AAD9VFA3_ACRCE|nr:Coagulation factor V [Acropora cervicornis]